mmetsp:Transcript_29457/g.51572  ORF Transcript_29457/g.51572 Transcript_29457/m.51572 type:complete len:162 (-) Transcript_29457:355-840(-)
MVQRAASPYEGDERDWLVNRYATAPLLLSFVLWALYYFAPLGRLPFLKDYDTLDGSSLDTGGLKYSDVERTKDYEIERYVCPAAGRGAAHGKQALKERALGMHAPVALSVGTLPNLAAAPPADGVEMAPPQRAADAGDPPFAPNYYPDLRDNEPSESRWSV